MSEQSAAVLDRHCLDQAPYGAVVRADIERLAIELTLHGEVDAVESAWRAFAKVADCTPFQAYEWQSAWIRNVGPRRNVQPAVVIGRDRGGAPLFLLPLAVESGNVRRLTWLAGELCDYNAPLLATGFPARVRAAEFPSLWHDICRLLQSRPACGFDLVALTKMPATVGSQANPFMTLGTVLNPSNAYATGLQGTWDAFYQAKRSSGTRRRDRTKLKRLAEFGAIRFVTPQDRPEIDRTLMTLIEQKTRSFARMGVPNIFARPGWREFFLDLATDPRSRDFVHVSRLDVGLHCAAVNLGLTFGDCYYHVLASHDDGDTARFGPGVAHLRELLRYAIERGLHRFDFTIGDERYKREWSDSTQPLYDHVAAATMRGWPVVALMHAARAAKRLVKQNEMLWGVFSRLRTRIGSRADGKSPLRESPPTAPE
jgi:CelD/BcsL family acetyltransferase involved in cellulose biosynthesis